MDNLKISYINSTSPKYLQVWELREEVLRKPLGMSLKNEDLSNDHVDTIFIAEQNGVVVACLMLHRVAADVYKLRQMAVSQELQGKGIGRILVSAAEIFAVQNGYKKIVLHARKVATGFYDALGYKQVGDQFSEVGIPHYAMEKAII